MSATLKTAINAALAAAIMAAVESLQNGHESGKTIAIHALIAAALVVAAYLQPSPVRRRKTKKPEA